MIKVSPVTGQAGYPGSGWQITSDYAGQEYFNLFGAWHTGHDLAKSANGGETDFCSGRWYSQVCRICRP